MRNVLNYDGLISYMFSYLKRASNHFNMTSEGPLVSTNKFNIALKFVKKIYKEELHKNKY